MSALSTEIQSQAREAFLTFTQEKGIIPPSLDHVAASGSVGSLALSQAYDSLDELEADVWLGFLQTTLFRLQTSEEYPDYMAREKLLAFYYTLIEVVSPYRSYLKVAWHQAGFRRYLAPFFESLRPAFDHYVNQLLKEGKGSQEVLARPIIDEAYPEIFWFQFVFVLNYWLTDHSPEATQTDAAIEKAVNLSFDLIGFTPLDSLFDFGKFLLQGK